MERRDHFFMVKGRKAFWPQHPFCSYVFSAPATPTSFAVLQCQGFFLGQDFPLPDPVFVSIFACPSFAFHMRCDFPTAHFPNKNRCP